MPGLTTISLFTAVGRYFNHFFELYIRL